MVTWRALDYQHHMGLIGGPCFFLLSIILQYFHTCSTDNLLLSVLYDYEKAYYCACNLRVWGEAESASHLLIFFTISGNCWSARRQGKAKQG